MTTDEKRALAFLAFLLFLSAALRFAGLPDPVAAPEGGGLDLASHIAATRAAVAERERRERPLAEGERIDPNTASAAELQRLPRVGPALADRIVAERDGNGRYRSAADLARVTGIGPAMVERLEPHLELRTTTRLPTSRARARTGRTTADPPATRAPAARAMDRAAGRSTPRPGGGWGGGGAPLDLNRADEAALAGLPGIGAVLARRVVEYRDSVGGFTSPDELARVKGIGPATLERIRPRVRVYR